MAAKKRRNEQEHGAGQSRRIQRRLPQDETQQAGPPDAADTTLWQLMEQQERAAGNAGSVWEDPLPDETPKYRAKKQKAPHRRAAKPKARKAAREPREKKPRRILRKLVLASLVLVALVGISLGVFVRHSTRNDDLYLNLDNIPYRDQTVLYYTDIHTGEVLEYAVIDIPQHKEYVSSGDIPQMLKDAFVAVEDNRFYDHNGVDIKRTGYAALNEVKRAITGSYIGGGIKQGGSTITQQLVKNLTGDDEASGIEGYLRKLSEISRARTMEKAYDKDTILTAYLNTIGFTGHTAGVQAEAKKLFGRPVNELTLAECASLAAITRNPARYNPRTNPETHVDRRNYVLDLMLEQGFIDAGRHAAAVAEPLVLAEETGIGYEEPIHSYFTETVMEHVADELAKQRGLSREESNFLVYRGGLRIYTTVEPGLQSEMERVMSGYSIFTQRDAQAAMVSVDYEGGIAAIVGRLGEKDINRPRNQALYAKRQTGSTMKAIGPYVLAVEKNKITWSSPFYDGPVMQVKDAETGEKMDWPANVTRRYTEKDILVAEAFAQSVNTVAVRVGQTTSWRSIYNFLKRDVGITTLTRHDVDPGPMVLGSTYEGITPLDMAKAYAMFGNGGYVYNTHSFTRIENGAGDVLLEVTVEGKQVISSETAYIMNRLMAGVMRGNGTASGRSPSGSMDAVGKTGTTSDNRDHWFIGLTPYYATAVWYGDEYNAPIYNANTPPIMAWKTVMERAQANYAYREFPTAAGVVQRAYCTVSGAAAGPNCPSATGYYKLSHEPEEGCPVHG